MHAPEEVWFDHEKLEVYRQAIVFIAWLSALLEGAVRVGDVKDQLDRASTSMPLNIAEGNGKYAPKDRCRFFDIAHGSALARMCCWSGHSGGQSEVNAGSDSPRKRNSSRNRPHANGANQEKLHARV